MVCEEEVKFNGHENLSEEVKDLIRKLLSKDPKERLGSGEDGIE